MKALLEIARLFPHYSPKQVAWLARCCSDPNMSNDAKLVMKVLCDEAGPNLDAVSLSEKEIARRVNRMIQNAKDELAGKAPRPLRGLPGGKQWGNA